MVDQAAREKPAMKEQKPSRLRQEVRPESTDDETDGHSRVVQVPHSDMVILDTQIDHSRHANQPLESHDPKLNMPEAPLSPNSQSTLNRFGATKKASVFDSDPTIFKTFTKTSLDIGNGSSQTFQPFSYVRPAVHQNMAPSANREKGRHIPRDNAALAITAIASQKEVPSDVQCSRDIARIQEQGSSSPLPLFPSTDFSLNKPGNSGLAQTETSITLPTSAQPIVKPKNPRRKNTDIKKDGKGIRKSPIQRNRESGRPQRSDATGVAQNPNVGDGTVPGDVVDLPNPSTIHTHNGLSRVIPRDDAMMPFTRRRSSELKLDCQIHETITQTRVPAEYETRTHTITRDAPQSVLPGLPDTLVPLAVPKSSLQPSPIVSTHCLAVNLEQQPLPMDQSKISGSGQERATYDNKILISPEDSQNDALQHPDEPQSNVYEYQPQSRTNKTLESPVEQPRESHKVLHRSSGRGRPERVIKPQGKQRAGSKLISFGSHGASLSPTMERLIEEIRLESLAETFRKHHEYNKQSECYQERITTLLEQVNFHKERATVYKQERDELKMALSNLTSKAKTNQKFLEGLQKDFEKLKKSTATAEQHNKKVLQAKITEIEQEKQDLMNEFEITTNKLAESQRKIRIVADELYVQLAIASSANKRLSERANELEAELAGEKKKRENIENKVFNQIQQLQHQLRYGSKAIVEKLEVFQTSIERVATHDSHDIQIKECLNILNDLQREPFLKSQDIHKAEGMLRFVRERIESGLEDLTKALMCSGQSNTEIHASVKEQLNCLRTDMMRYKEAVAENRKLNDSNIALTEQLVNQHQVNSRLNEQIEHLHQVEISLKNRSCQLERDLNDLAIETDTSRSEVLASECNSRELRRRLEEVENDLKVAKEKINDGEQLRQDLQMEAAEYKERFEAVKKEKTKAIQEQMNEKRNAAAIQETLLGEYTIKLGEKEQEFQSEVTQLKLNLAEKEKSCQKLSESLDNAIKHVEELRKKTEDQKVEKDELQAQVSRQQSELEVVRRDADDRVSEMQREAQSNLQSSQHKITTLEREKQSLLSILEKVRADSDSNKELTRLLHIEKIRMQEEMHSLSSAIDDKNTEIMRVRDEAAIKNQQLIEQHGNDIESYKRRLAETSTSLKEAEAKARLLEDQYQAKIAADRKVAESKLLELEKEYHSALQKVQEQNVTRRRHGIQDMTPSPSVLQSGQGMPVSKPRKKVNGENQSVIEVTQEKTCALQLNTLFNAEVSLTQSDDLDLFSNLHNDISGTQQDGVHDNSIFNQGCDFVPDTQDLGALTLSQVFSSEKPGQTTQPTTPNQTLSSTEFSSVASEELTQMQKEAEFVSIPKNHNWESRSNKPEKSSNTTKTGAHVERTPEPSSHSSPSRERPRSQANTSSRMMPPPDSISKQVQPPPGARVTRIKLPNQREKFDNILQSLSGSGPRDKRKSPTSQTNENSTPKKQRRLSPAKSGASSSGSQTKAPRSSRRSAAGPGSMESDASHTKGTAPRLTRPEFQDRVSGSQSHTLNYMSSDKTHSSCQQGSSQTHTTPPTRYSSRVTRSKSRNGTAFGDDFSDRFNEELQGWY